MAVAYYNMVFKNKYQIIVAGGFLRCADILQEEIE